MSKDNYDDHKPQTVGVELPSKLDEILDCANWNEVEFDYKQAINQYISEIIGDDEDIANNFETAPDGGIDIDSDNPEHLSHLCKFADYTGRNTLRAEQRKKAGLL